MKILVTGGAGFIGSHVVDRFIAEGHEVVVVDNLSTGRRANLNPQARLYEVDIRSPELAEVFAQERPEVVDHHAAQAEVRRSVVDPLFDAGVNILGSLNLLQNAVLSGVRKVIYISSGGAIYGEPEYMPCDERHPVQPMSPYGTSKHTVEHYLRLYRQLHGLDYTVLRYANVYGPRQDPHGEAGVVAIFAGQMLNGGQPVIYGDGLQERDFVYVADCARANALALSGGSGEAFNIGSGEAISINGLFALMKEITGYGGHAEYAPAKPGDVLRIYLDASKAQRLLGWAPTVGLRQGLAETIAFVRQGRAR